MKASAVKCRAAHLSLPNAAKAQTLPSRRACAGSVALERRFTPHSAKEEPAEAGFSFDVHEL
jgi:hypothetical protein